MPAAPISRRRLLALLPVTTLFVGPACSRRPGSSAAPAELAREIRSALATLRLDPGGLTEFCQRYVAHLAAGELTEVEELDATRRYLLSSDLFSRPADSDAPVRYRFFYDPYLAPCGNPLAGPLPSDPA